MPRGDAQRAWFPEMLKELEQFWSSDVSWDELIAFCSRITAVRADIWETNGIQAPLFTCSKCGQTGRARLPDISPRSAFFALQKLALISKEEFKTLDRDWAKYRKENRLNAQGYQEDPQAAKSCDHRP